MKYHTKNTLTLFFLLVLVLLLFGKNNVFGATYYGSKWEQLETQHTILLYQEKESLEKFNRKIKYGPNNSEQLTKSVSALADDTIRQKIDFLFKRVQQILDMRKKMKKVKIKIYSDKKNLQSAYTRLYHTRETMRAWYIFEKNTVYVSTEDINEGMLAHELAHSIIDHFFAVRPPANTAEILARYVDKHLNKKNYFKR